MTTPPARAFALALVTAAALGAAACDAGSPQSCTVVCSELGQCPDGTSCGTDGYCHTADEESRTCTAGSLPDGSVVLPPDGSVIDEPDGAIVVDPDGAIDPPDASVGDDACAGDATFAEADLGPFLIPDGDPLGILRQVEVTGMCAAVQSVEISIDITHSYSGDIGVALISPAGETVQVITPSDDPVDNINEVFEVDIATGEDANGSWALEVVDTLTPDVGTLDRWSIGINRAAP